MNLYMLVEGRLERRVYRKWLSFLLPDHREVDRAEDFTTHGYLVRCGNGYPSYLKMIDHCAQEMTAVGLVDHFLICVDSEGLPIAQVRAKIMQRLEAWSVLLPKITVVVQHLCMETWLLGHQGLRPEHVGAEFQPFMTRYDVFADDPELLPEAPAYHKDYLKALFRNRGWVYTEKNPGRVRDRAYYDALVARLTTTGHIRSFDAFRGFFDPVG